MKKYITTLILVSLLSATSTFALSPYQVELSGNTRALLLNSHRPQLVTLRTHEGKFKVVLRRKHFKVENKLRLKQKPKFYTGRLLTKAAQSPRYLAKGLALSIINSNVKVTFYGQRRGRSYAAILDQAALNTNKAIGRLRHLPSNFPVPCGLHQHTEPLTVGGIASELGQTSAQYNPTKVIELVTEGDSAFYAAEGADSSSVNAEILSTVNSASAEYEQQIGLSFDVVGQYLQTNSSTDPYAGRADSGDLLTAVLCNRNPLPSNSTVQSECSGYSTGNGPAETFDLYHLFTGQSMLENVIGLAYVGVTCRSSSIFSFGLTGGEGLVSDSLKYLIFQHEVGHNFNASHTSGVMGATFNGSATFGSTSISEITTFVDSYGSCLAEGSSGGGGGGETEAEVDLSSLNYSSKTNLLRLSYSLSNFSGAETAPCKLRVIAAKTASDAESITGTAKVVYTKTLTSCSAASKQLRVTIRARNGKNRSNSAYYVALSLRDADGQIDISSSSTFRSKIKNLISNLKSAYSKSKP